MKSLTLRRCAVLPTRPDRCQPCLHRVAPVTQLVGKSFQTLLPLCVLIKGVIDHDELPFKGKLIILGVRGDFLLP